MLVSLWSWRDTGIADDKRNTGFISKITVYFYEFTIPNTFLGPS